MPSYGGGFDAALQGAVLKGPQAAQNWEAMQNMYRAQRGRDMFAQFLYNDPQQPTADNPPPGMSGTDVQANANAQAGMNWQDTPAPAAAPETPLIPFLPSSGKAPATQKAPASATASSSDAVPMQLVPPSLRAMVQAIKTQNPNATPSDVLAAVEAASPYMSQEQQAQAAAMKMRFDYFKAGAEQDDKALGRKIQLGNLSERIRKDNMLAHYLATKPNSAGLSLELQGYNKQRMALGQKLSHYQGILYNGVDPKTGQVLTQEQRDSINKYLDQGNLMLNDINSRVDSTIANAVGQGYVSADMATLTESDAGDATPAETPDTPDTGE